MKTSQRGQVDPFIVMDVMEAARKAEAAGRRIIHMEVGQPATPAPKGAREALAQALEQPLGYTVALGLPALRKGIAALYQRWYGIDLDPARVVVTPGSSGAFILAFSALFDAGDRVALGEPGYPSYRQILRAMSLEPVGIPTRPEDRYQPRPEDLPDGCAGLILASPGNPSGTMLRTDELRALSDSAKAKGMALISDEIYHGLTYERPATTALRFSDEAIVVNSFSKYYCMTGWRVGWLVLPERFVRPVERLSQSLAISTPYLRQIAAEAAFDARAELEAVKAGYARNRAALMQALPAIGLGEFVAPDGAFYIYTDIGRLSNDSLDFCKRMLHESGVAATPGLDFDRARGNRTLRLSYAGPEADITEAIARLQKWIN